MMDQVLVFPLLSILVQGLLFGILVLCLVGILFNSKEFYLWLIQRKSSRTQYRKPKSD